MYKRTGQVDILGLMRIVEWKSKTQITIKANIFKIGDYFWDLGTDTDYAIADILDTGSISNGKDYYVYACNDSGALTFKVSLASTYPAGFDADTSRKIGGFHTLCASVGTISGHTLSGYVANYILPASVWDLKHRSANDNNIGMLWNPYNNDWEQIYDASDDGAGGVQSVYGATILDTINWIDICTKAGVSKVQFFNDAQFQIAAEGSNEGTNIAGSADPVTTGGHSDTAGRRMISNLGHEDMCGVVWQWLLDQSYRFDAAANHTHQVTVSGDPETVSTGNPSGDVAPAYSYKDETGGKGQLYTQGTYGDVKPRAGGGWDGAANCGSRGRGADDSRWSAGSGLGGRFLSEPKK